MSTDHKEMGKGWLDALKFERAIDSFTKAIELDATDAEAYELRAIARYQVLDIPGAVEDLETSTSLDPTSPSAWAHLGAIAIQRNELEQAVVCYERALEYAPASVAYLSNLAFVQLSLRNNDACIALCNQVLDGYSIDTWALEYRAGAYFNKKMYEEGIRDYIVLNKNTKEPNAVWYNNIGFGYSLIGELTKARNNLSIALELEPYFAYAHDNMGYVYYLEEAYEKALERINYSLELDPANSFGYKNRALVHIATGEPELAQSDLQRALKLGFAEDYGDEVQMLLNKLPDSYGT